MYAATEDRDPYRGLAPAFARKIREKRRLEERERRAREAEELRATLRAQREAEKRRARQEKYQNALPGDVTKAFSVITVRSARDDERDLIANVAKIYGLTYEHLVGDARTREITQARHQAIRAVADARPDLSCVAIGRMFGGRDHTSVLHSLRLTKKPGDVR